MQDDYFRPRLATVAVFIALSLFLSLLSVGCLAAARHATCGTAFFAFSVVRLGAFRLVDRGNWQVVVFALLQSGNFNAFRQFQVAQVNYLVHLDSGHVHFDELGQVLRQTDHFNFGHGVGDHATAFLDANAAVFVDEVQRYVNVNLVVLVNAQEVGVSQDGLVRMTLQILQDHALFFALNVDGQDVREEGFVFDGLFQLVVPDGDRSCVFAATVDDGRNLTLFAMQALKTLPMSVLYGVFLYMGITALNGNQFWERILMLFMQPSKYPKRPYTDRIPHASIHKMTAVQLFLFALLYVVKTIKSIAIGFPLIIAACIPIRIYLLPKMFDADVLTLLDGDDDEDGEAARVGVVDLAEMDRELEVDHGHGDDHDNQTR